MRTLTTTTVKKRLAVLLQESRDFIDSHNQQIKVLQDRCPHEETTENKKAKLTKYGKLIYDEHSTTYCAACDKKLDEPYRMS